MPFIAKYQVDFPRKPPPVLFEHGDIQKFNFGKTENTDISSL
jgi:hypothetical protein